MSSGGYVQGGRIDADEEFERVLYTSGTIEWIYDTRFRKEKKVREKRERERKGITTRQDFIRLEIRLFSYLFIIDVKFRHVKHGNR